MKATFICGLPGSGKTTLANTFSDAVILDDCESLAAIAEALNGGNDVVLTSPHFCKTKARANAEQWVRDNFPECRIEWIYFENAPAKALANAARQDRKGRAVSGLIQMYTEIYQIPAGVTPLKIWQAPSPG